MPGSIVALVTGPGIAARLPASVQLVNPGPRPGWLEHGTVASWAPKPERRAAHERVSAYHQAQLAELLSHIGQRPAATVAARSTPMPWMRPSTTTTVPPQNCGSSASPAAAPHAEFIAGLLDRMTTRAKAIDWWERATPRRHQ